MKSFGLFSTILLAAIVPASAQEISFTCSSDVPEMSFTIYTTARESNIGERIQLSSSSKGITYWKIFLRATQIEDGTVTYESREGVLVNRSTGKTIPGKFELLVNWAGDDATYTLFPPRGFKSGTPTQGKCE